MTLHSVDLQSWSDALAKAIKFADEQRHALAWSEIGSVMESIRAKREALRAEENPLAGPDSFDARPQP